MVIGPAGVKMVETGGDDIGVVAGEVALVLTGVVGTVLPVLFGTEAFKSIGRRPKFNTRRLCPMRHPEGQKVAVIGAVPELRSDFGEAKEDVSDDAIDAE
jgi:hypothetical protein